MGYRRGYVRPPRGMIGADVRRNLGTPRATAATKRPSPPTKRPALTRRDTSDGAMGLGLISLLSLATGGGTVSKIVAGSMGTLLLLIGWVLRVRAGRAR